MSAITKCPGFDEKNWKESDLAEVACPNCGTTVEFWKDDAARDCPSCGQKITNPRAAAEQPEAT